MNNPVLLIEGTPNFDRYLEKQGLTPKFETIGTPDIISMPEGIATLFGAEKGMQVVHRKRVQGTSEIPLRIEENWYPADLALPFLDAMRADSNINVAREIRLAHGVAITKIKEDVRARYPTAKEMEVLNITRTAPVLEDRRTFLTGDDKVILYEKTILVSAYFLLHYEYEVPM